MVATGQSFFYSGRAAGGLPRLRKAALFGLRELRGAGEKEEEEMWVVDALGGVGNGLGYNQAVLYRCMKLFGYKSKIFSKEGECELSPFPHHEGQRKLSTKRW